MATDAIIAVSVVFSVAGFVLVVFILLNSLCLWQARPSHSMHNAETDSSDSSVEQSCFESDRYQVRAYIGFCPRLKGRRWRLAKKYEYSLRRCWFRLCCGFCQELQPDKPFLDEIFIPPAIIISPASFKVERPDTLLVSPMYRNVSFGLDAPKELSPRRGSMPKISILEPDPIMLSVDRYTPSQSMAQEETETVDFYVYQLEGRPGDRILY